MASSCCLSFRKVPSSIAVAASMVDHGTENRQRIDEAFAKAKLPQRLEWTEEVTAGRWVIRYRVGVNYQAPDRTKMLELDRSVFRADRPFLFLIRERLSGTILFVGKLASPPGG